MTTTEERPEVKQPIDVTQAIRVGKAYIQDIYQIEPRDNLLVEEVEYRDEGLWYITFGFDRLVYTRPKNAISAAVALAAGDIGTIERIYKQVIIDDEGRVLRMIIRKP